jgi:uncharacterized protein YdeI (YjbR/CyaY-like superfamily)
MKTFDPSTVEEWREWLARHHDAESEVWLIFHKKHTGKPSVAYKDALDEALCYGWIDSLIKRIDADRYARKFTPRKLESNWSSVNIKRYDELKAANRLAAPGLARSPNGRPVVDGARTYKPNVVPAYIVNAIRKDGKAWPLFEKLAPSHRRLYVMWIDSAKRDDTRQKRIAEAIKMLRAGKKPGI